jgi:hypothetical protein
VDVDSLSLTADKEWLVKRLFDQPKVRKAPKEDFALATLETRY